MRNTLSNRTFKQDSRWMDNGKHKVYRFNPANAPEAIRLYKNGTSVAELKRKWHCYGNPIVAVLRAAGVYKERVKKASRKTVLHMPVRKAVQVQRRKAA